MTATAESLGKPLALHLLTRSEQDAAFTSMDAVLDAARAGKFSAAELAKRLCAETRRDYLFLLEEPRASRWD